MTPELNALLIKARALATELRITLEAVCVEPGSDFSITFDGDRNPLEYFCLDATEEVGKWEGFLDDLPLTGSHALFDRQSLLRKLNTDHLTSVGTPLWEATQAFREAFTNKTPWPGTSNIKAAIRAWIMEITE